MSHRTLPAITVTPEPEPSRVRVDIDAPGHSHVSIYWAVETPEPYAWNHVYSMAVLPDDGRLVAYHWAAPLNAELSYKALLYTRESLGLLRAAEDYTETVTTTLEPAP